MAAASSTIDRSRYETRRVQRQGHGGQRGNNNRGGGGGGGRQNPGGNRQQRNVKPQLSALDILLGRTTPSATAQDNTNGDATDRKTKKSAKNSGPENAQDGVDDKDDPNEISLPASMDLRWLAKKSRIETTKLLYALTRLHETGLSEIGSEMNVKECSIAYKTGMGPMSPKMIGQLEAAAARASLRKNPALQRSVKYACDCLIVNQELASLVLLEYDVLADFDKEEDLDEYATELDTTTEEYRSYPLRPPVVTVMGHVDHGKTTLLDTLRNSQVAAGEAGGITQSVGAFNVMLEDESAGKQRVVFVDTPGHAAFSAMRKSGSAVTDIIVLIVAATDGLRPQTLESIKLAQAADIPMVVALTKVDVATVDKETAMYQVCTDLQLEGVETELVGGDVPVVPIAAPKGIGIKELTETILLQAETMDIRAPVKSRGEAVVLESFFDKYQGQLVDVIVRSGTLKRGDTVVVGNQVGKIRSLLDPVTKKTMKEAPPSTPVRIVGLKDIAKSGSDMLVVNNDKRAREILDYREKKSKLDQLVLDSKAIEKSRQIARKAYKMKARRWGPKRDEPTPVPEEEAEDAEEDPGQIREPVVVPIIVKADTEGSLSALRYSIEAMSYELQEDEPTDDPDSETKKKKKDEFLLPYGSELKIVTAGVGPITQFDIDTAATVGCNVFGFNVRATGAIVKGAQEKDVEVSTRNVIYHLLDEVKREFLGKMAPLVEQEVAGSATVGMVFDMKAAKRSQVWKVAGCKVDSGQISQQLRIRVVRDGEVIHDSSGIDSLKVFKDSVKTVNQGSECGISLTQFQDFKVGDVIESYVEKEVSFADAYNERRKGDNNH